jgi:hypothetical protein
VFTALFIFVFFPDEREIKFNDDARESELQSVIFYARDSFPFACYFKAQRREVFR